MDIKLENFEELNTDRAQEMISYPYTYDPIRKQIICAPGTVFVDLKEIKDENNKNENRMKTIHKGFSRVSPKTKFFFSK